ncbi:MAG TPA: T9SS type A sorting domain-containing protein [Anditalea sp.]|nr:T9SS type A sorting domain-containing protein [Anditalea sp.]
MPIANFWLRKINVALEQSGKGALYYLFCQNISSELLMKLSFLVFFTFFIFIRPCQGQSECSPDIYEIHSSYNRITRVYIFRCSTMWEVPEYMDEALLDSPVVFIVAGGGGGGMGESAGGGGAGEIVYKTVNLKPGNPVMINIGDGGIGSLSYNNRGGRGGNTIFAGNMALGGGGGGSSNNVNGGRGGSGGGAAANQETGVSEGAEGSYTYRGGHANRNNDNVRAGGGGGGAGGPGAHGAPPNPGEGGIGRMTNLLDGVPLSFIRNAFAAGGGSTGRNPSLNSSFFSNGGKVNGEILGGSGNISDNGIGGKGRGNTGSGGGAGRGAGGDGGTGVVVLRMEFGILPVNWNYVRSHFNISDRSVSIEWATTKEWENSHFEVQRSFKGVEDWEIIGSVKGMGWTDQMSSYSYTDKKLPLSEENVYYRLKQVDFNLQADYSKTVFLRIPTIKDASRNWKVYPNPVTDTNFNISRTENEEISSIEVRLIASKTGIDRVNNENELTEAVKGMLEFLSKGVYVIEIKWNQKTEYVKILKN